MKLIAITFTFLFITSDWTYAQDLIVTNKGDSLNCKIIYIESENIHFMIKDKNETRVTFMPVSHVKVHKKNFYPTSSVSEEDFKKDSLQEASQVEIKIDSSGKASMNKKVSGNYQKMRIGFYGGLSYETAKVSTEVPNEIQDYIRELKSGYHFGADFTYFFSENIGFGIKYSIFSTQNSLERVFLYDSATGQTHVGSMKDEIEVQFFAPSFSARISSDNKKINFLGNVAMGYLSYKDQATLISDYTLTGGTVGLLLDIGSDFAIANNLYFGVGMSYLMGSINEFEFDNGIQKRTIKLEEGTAEGLNRFDLSIGFHWSK